jgi:glycosyltransferase involved in cell wall biosynthesis
VATLHVQLECDVPGEVAVGAGTAVFVCGWCFCPEAAIAGLSFSVDGEPQAVTAWGMPRLDPFRALHPTLDPFAAGDLERDPRSAEDPELRSYRSGFWGVVRLGPGAPAAGCVLSLVAELAGGERVQAELARFTERAPVERLRPSWPSHAGTPGPRVAIAMATYDPPADLLQAQLDSIRAQTHGDWVCVISDDCSPPRALQTIRDAIAGDERFLLSVSPRRLGFYRNFERALELVPDDAAYVALADQDDRWHPDKLAALLAGIGDAPLIYSDARVIARDGSRISDTWWDRRRNNHSDLLSLLVANAVTGAASMVRRDLLDLALPFPPAQFAHFHDHWLGLVAAATGEIAYEPRPLYDYVQHGGASLGHAGANQMTSLRDRLRRQRPLRERVHLWRMHYFVDLCRLQQFAAVLDMRCGPRMPAAKRRALNRFIAADRSPVALVRFALRGARELVGTPETLGAEWMLFHALAWRRMLAWSARERPQTRLRLDALPPPSLIQHPGRQGLPESVAAIAAKTAPLRWAVAGDAPRRINLLIPTIDLQHFFGGYIGKFNLARRLAERGWRVRVVTVDPVGPLPGDWRAVLEGYAGLDGLFDHVEVTFGREAGELEVSPDDGFIATTWWTAPIARAAVDQLGGDRFLYLIQEYEPFTFPMGTYAALAEDSYRHPHVALFSSELLRGFFRDRLIGVFAGDTGGGDAASASFQNAITPVPRPTADELAGRRSRRLLFYARPEDHAARNMFELGVLALSEAVAAGSLAGWELNGAGTVQRGRAVPLGGGAVLELVPRSDQRSYAELLRAHDVGLALMYTPHPSLVPIEMASAGMVVVTNSFANKTPQALTGISRNLLAVPPSPADVAAGLRAAVGRAEDFAARADGSAVRWSSDWNESLPDELLDRLTRALWPR